MGLFGSKRVGRKKAAESDAPSYLRPYQEAVAQHGPRFESLLWRNRDFQRTRFAVLVDAVDLTGRVVADMGCGNADLAEFLATHHVPLKRYIGVEGVPALAESSRSRIAALGVAGDIVEADFAAADLFTTLHAEHGVDVVMFSGSLNTFEQASALGVLDRAWSALACDNPADGGALVFNFLSTDGPKPPSNDPTDPARRFDPGQMLAWARTKTPRVVFRQDYLDGHDAMIALLPPTA